MMPDVGVLFLVLETRRLLQCQNFTFPLGMLVVTRIITKLGIPSNQNQEDLKWRPFSASQPAMGSIGPGPHVLEIAQRREVGRLLRPGTEDQRALINARK